ncbi:hypothetical protein LUZ63_016343 [Rhynchospora breviuscula]|uniref:Uncharacterized protein n=1 Tax=Rhynchospora breviuscula TaxID=2022672 RepID=A0A9P9Z9S8_9POAL|nr:hypothetical protein LUZ63_016343 [Rhynchospora breviuscula]
MVATVLSSDRFFDSDQEWRCHNQCQYKKKVPTSLPEEAPVGPSNLDRFLEATRPSVPARYLSKARAWRNSEAPYFLLSDLWDSFEEWSVYGAGVPVVANGCDSMVQYYVPYLSGMQLYGEPRRQWVDSRQCGADSDDSDSYYPESSSDGSSDNEHERVVSNGGAAATDTHALLHDSNCGGCKGKLLFEYLEQNPPYMREPLSQKINSLEKEFPVLKSARSCNLSPGSWISVAWYPIYRIPTGNTLRDIEACFLTYHSLSSPIKGFQSEFNPNVLLKEESPMMSLPVFGLASYKFRPAVWTPNQSQKQTALSLLQAADRWLRALDVYHPDFQFFISHSSYRK